MTSSLRVLRPEPLCAETRLDRQRELLTPNDQFYVRNNFPLPTADWPGLAVEGGFARPRRLQLADLEAFEQHELVATLECAGNGRASLNPPVPGEQWGLGAVATAAWHGPRLSDLLAMAEPLPGTVEILFECADGFARSLPLEKAQEPDVLVALRMNSLPLPLEHGAPVRLLAGGWYGMASPKWLTRISALLKPFRGHFQVERYVIGEVPVRAIAPRAVVTTPAAGSAVGLGPVTLHGFAWSADGGAQGVEISTDGGLTWTPARLLDPPSPHAWSRWELTLRPAAEGELLILARAFDASGGQPLNASWNPLGYQNNGVVPHPLRVTNGGA